MKDKLDIMREEFHEILDSTRGVQMTRAEQARLESRLFEFCKRNNLEDWQYKLAFLPDEHMVEVHPIRPLDDLAMICLVG